MVTYSSITLNYGVSDIRIRELAGLCTFKIYGAVDRAKEIVSNVSFMAINFASQDVGMDHCRIITKYTAVRCIVFGTATEYYRSLNRKESVKHIRYIY